MIQLFHQARLLFNRPDLPPLVCLHRRGRFLCAGAYRLRSKPLHDPPLQQFGIDIANTGLVRLDVVPEREPALLHPGPQRGGRNPHAQCPQLFCCLLDRQNVVQFFTPSPPFLAFRNSPVYRSRPVLSWSGAGLSGVQAEQIVCGTIPHSGYHQEF